MSMFLELIATFFAGIAAAGVIMVLNKVLGGRLPRWFVPAGAGLAMIGMTISNEYGWYPRASANLPDGVVVADTVTSQVAYRPWTYVKPYVERFVAVDVAAAKINPDFPGEKLVTLLFYGRWSPVHSVDLRVDCDGARRSLPGDGRGDDVIWQDVDPDDPILRTVCGG